MAKRSKNYSYAKEYRRARKNYLKRLKYYEEKFGQNGSETYVPTFKEIKESGFTEEEIKEKIEILDSLRGEKLSSKYQEQPKQDEVIDVDILDRIAEDLNTMPEVRYADGMEVTVEKDDLLFIFELTVETAIENGSLGSLVNYYKENFTMFDNSSTIVRHDSKQHNIEMAITRMFAFLKGGNAMTLEEASKANDYSERI